MQTAEPERGVRAELYVRNELPPPALNCADAVHFQLEDLDARDLLAGVDRTEWDKRAPLDALDGAVRDTYLSFSAWADDRGVRLTPFFTTRECYSAAHGGMVDWLVVPALCLAVYDGDELAAVYPHANDADTYTVDDGVASLRNTLLSGGDGAAVTVD
jgi:hypothetical protein